jgi:hypothetical protein
MNVPTRTNMAAGAYSMRNLRLDTSSPVPTEPVSVKKVVAWCL